MEQKIITSHSAEALNNQIAKMIGEGWSPVGSHQVVIVNEQLQFSGSQHKRTLVEREYSQTMVKPVFDIARPLGEISDKELFLKGYKMVAGNELKEGILYKIGYDFNGPTTAIARYVEKTNTIYFISLDKDGGAGMETPSKIKNLQIIDVITTI